MVMQLSNIHIIVIIYPGEYLHSFLNYKLTQELRTQLNHLASLAKWLSVRLRTKWFWVRVQLQSLHHKELYQTFRVKEIIQEPTRVTSNTFSLIDHMLTNAGWKISQKGVIDIGLSDHQVIY